MSFYESLLAQTQAERDYLLGAPIIQQAMTGQVALRSYIAFLTEAYHHVKHTVPLLMACGARLPERLEWLREAIADGLVSGEHFPGPWVDVGTPERLNLLDHEIRHGLI